MMWPQEKDELHWPAFDFWWLFSLALTRPPRLGTTAQNNTTKAERVLWGLQVTLTRPRKEPALGQGVNYPSFRTAGCTAGEQITGRDCTGPIRMALWKYMQSASTSTHKSDWVLAWKAEMIIWDNQAFTRLMLKKKAVYGNEVWEESRCETVAGS